jgi:hypothetical protein
MKTSWDKLSLAERARINYELWNIRWNYWVLYDLYCKIHGHLIGTYDITVQLNNNPPTVVKEYYCKRCKQMLYMNWNHKHK